MGKTKSVAAHVKLVAYLAPMVQHLICVS